MARIAPCDTCNKSKSIASLCCRSIYISDDNWPCPHPTSYPAITSCKIIVLNVLDRFQTRSHETRFFYISSERQLIMLCCVRFLYQSLSPSPAIGAPKADAKLVKKINIGTWKSDFGECTSYVSPRSPGL